MLPSLLPLLQVSFEADVELSQMNEYEILQILMGDCRERLAAYKKSYEEDVKIAQQRTLTPKVGARAGWWAVCVSGGGGRAQARVRVLCVRAVCAWE